MNARTLLVFPIVILVLVVVGLPSEACAQQETRKVRVRNQTTDADVRVHCSGFRASGFKLDVPQGQQRTHDNVGVGDRGIVVWEDFNEKVIATGSFELPSNKNVIVVVTGDQTNGYNLAFEVADPNAF